MRRLGIVVALGLALALVLATAAALAQPEPRGSVPDREERQQDRAQIITQRIELVIARFNNNMERHVAAYNAVKAKVTEMITTLAAKGYDVSKLKTDLQTWDEMIRKAAQDYATFINYLKTAQQYAPYESQGQFKDAIEQARRQLHVYRQDVLDIRHYYQTVIRPDVAALAEQSPTPPSTTP